MQWLWAPRSVWQIVVVAMSAVLIPPVLLLFHTTQVMESLAEQSRLIAEEAIQVTEATRNLSPGLIDMERIARQYQVLGDPALKELYDARLESLEPSLLVVGRFLRQHDMAGSIGNISSLLHDIQTLLTPDRGSELTTLLEGFSERQELANLLTSAARDTLRERMQAQASATLAARSNLIRTALLLVPLTILMIIAFTFIIVRPMQHLRKSIRKLGYDDPRQAQPIRMNGPSEMVNLGSQLEWLRQRLADANEQKQTFVQHVSHELKTPLASVREGTQLLKDEVVGGLSHAQKEVLELVDENSRNLQHLIENLLLISRSEKQFSVVSEPFNLSDLSQNLLRVHSLMLANQEMTLCLGGPNVTLVMDRKTLETILDNLLSNAVAYGAKGGKIWLEWTVDEKTLKIRVANTGEAISSEEQSMIFEPFYQGRRKRLGAVKGSGVGLAVARQCAENLNGRLYLDRHEHADTCFVLKLPTRYIASPDEN